MFYKVILSFKFQAIQEMLKNSSASISPVDDMNQTLKLKLLSMQNISMFYIVILSFAMFHAWIRASLNSIYFSSAIDNDMTKYIKYMIKRRLLNST